jgi:glycosidase
VAGTFNDWATSNADYRLQEKNGRLELARFWPCGGYEFKFVFDGSWARHLGDAGGGRLTQPGGNIPLQIRQSGFYAVVLDGAGKQWRLENRPASQPHALFVARPVNGRRILLDPSPSISRAGHAIQSFDWDIQSEDLPDDDWALRRTETGDFLSVNRPGHFNVTLIVDDGKFQDRLTQSAFFGQGYELRVVGEPPDAGHMLHELDGGAWGTVFCPKRDGSMRFSITGHDLVEPLVSEEQRVATGQPCLVTYDSQARSIAVLKEGWHAFDLVVGETFRLPKGLRVERVEVVGDFNGWQPGRTPTWTAGGDRYQTVVQLPDGLYHYKYLVNGCVYAEDPSADEQYREPDGSGGHNGGFLIGPDARRLGPARPNHVATAALKHDPGDRAYFRPISPSLVRLVVRTLADDATGVEVVLDGRGSTIAMSRSDRHAGFENWTAQVWAEGSGLDYTFLITDGSERFVLDTDGPRSDADEARHPFRQQIRMSFETPDWAKHAVWYQIFPERFRNGNPGNDPPRTVPWTHAWYKPYRPADAKDTRAGRGFVERGDFNSFIYDRRYGGDFQGIREKLPYLRELGVTAIYLNPIFLAESLHKYDASDFRHVDDYFGVRGSLEKIQGESTDPGTWQWSESDRVFLDFVREAHRLGFRVIIDGVFNHVGRDFWAFRDVLKNGKDSPYAGWFDVTSWKPFHYKAWDRDDGSLPRLKHDDALGLCKPVRDHLFAVTRRWMDPDGDGNPADGVDGWRLDVASDINANFWRDWRKLVKSINSDAFIVAELWQESRAWLDGRTFDAVMNYPFARRCQSFFVNDKKATSPTKLDEEIGEMLGWYQPQVNYVLQNLFGSHDTDRPASMFMNPDIPYDRENRIQDNGPKYNPARPTSDCYRRMRLMVTFQMTFLGAPMVYYGDEVGMYGADDPSNRKPMLWPDLMPYDDPAEKIETEVFDHHRRMIAIRNTCPALRLGLFQVLATDDAKGIFAFARTLGNKSVVVVINNSDHARRLDVPVPWPDDTHLIRLDDPQACRLVEPPADAPTARPTVQQVKGFRSKLRVRDGRLQGGRLAPRSGGVFADSLP